MCVISRSEGCKQQLNWVLKVTVKNPQQPPKYSLNYKYVHIFYVCLHNIHFYCVCGVGHLIQTHLFMIHQTFLMSTDFVPDTRQGTGDIKVSNINGLLITWDQVQLRITEKPKQMRSLLLPYIKEDQKYTITGWDGRFMLQGARLLYLSALPCQLQSFILDVSSWSKMTARAPAMTTPFHTAGKRGVKIGASPPIEGGFLEAHIILLLTFH